MDDDHDRPGREQADRGKVLHRVERRFRIECRIHRERPERTDHKRVAVGRGFRDQIERDHAAGTRPVLDDDRLTERFVQLGPDQAAKNIDRAARGEGHNDAHRFRRVRLRVGHAAEARA
jgi:hypothetical protein